MCVGDGVSRLCECVTVIYSRHVFIFAYYYIKLYKAYNHARHKSHDKSSLYRLFASPRTARPLARVSLRGVKLSVHACHANYSALL